MDASSPGSLPLCSRARPRRRAWPASMRSAGSMVSFYCACAQATRSRQIVVSDDGTAVPDDFPG